MELHPNETRTQPREGGCACGAVRYRLLAKPMYVHCCHCSWCQRETGSAFVINALIETTSVEVLRGDVRAVDTPSSSGSGQTIVRCSACQVALWSHYGSAKDKVAFVRAGTLDRADLVSPDIHIYTSTRQAWVNLPTDAHQVSEFYKRSEHWPQASLARYRQALGRS